MDEEDTGITNMGKPNPPGTGQVDLRDCIDKLLKFILESHVDEASELYLGPTRDYCCNLLREDSPDQGGFPPSPSYKRLALFLHEFITCTKLYGTDREAWGEMLANKGSELVDVFKAINFELHVQEPFFTQLKDVVRRWVENNLRKLCYWKLQTDCSRGFSSFQQMHDVHSYNSFSEMLVAEGLQNILPGVKTTEEGVIVYRRFYTEEKERSNGVVAICVTKPASQPYNILASIISNTCVTLTCLSVFVSGDGTEIKLQRH